MKILLLVNPYMQGGFLGLLEHLSEMGVIIATENPRKEVFYNINGMFSQLGAMTKRNAIWYPSIRRLKEICIEHEIEHIHVLGEPTYLSTLSALRLKKMGIVKAVSCRVAQNEKHILPFPFNYCLSEFRKHGDYCFPVSLESEAFVKSQYNIKINSVFANGVPSDFYTEPATLRSSKRILYVGTFLERKGITDLISALDCSEFSDYKITFVGDSPEKIRQHLSTSGLKAENLVVKERLPMNDLIKLYDEATLVVVPSRHTDGKDLGWLSQIFPIPWREQFGRVIVEAYSRGTAVLGSDSGAIPEIIIDKEYIFRAGDVLNLRENMIKFFNAKERRSSDVYVLEAKKYSWKRLAKELIYYIEHPNR